MLACTGGGGGGGGSVIVGFYGTYNLMERTVQVCWGWQVQHDFTQLCVKCWLFYVWSLPDVKLMTMAFWCYSSCVVPTLVLMSDYVVWNCAHSCGLEGIILYCMIIVWNVYINTCTHAMLDFYTMSSAFDLYGFCSTTPFNALPLMCPQTTTNMKAMINHIVKVYCSVNR